MNDELKIGSRVSLPKMTAWGIGQIVALEPPNLTVYFELAGQKKRRSDLVELRRLEGEEADSSIRDNKFKATQKSRARKFDDPKYYKSGKSTSRKQFIESLGATCSNWNWSWSFVDEEARKVFFGAWQDFFTGNRPLIFSNEWKTRQGRNRPSWPESRENIRLIEEEGYFLNVYTMILDPDSESDYEVGPRKIGAILNDVSEAKLLRDGDDWFAVFAEEREL